MVSQTGQDHVGQMQEHLRSYSLGTQLTNSKVPALGVSWHPGAKESKLRVPKRGKNKH